jgi:hypothetical protein
MSNEAESGRAPGKNGWDTYGKLVLQELERLSSTNEKLSLDLGRIKESQVKVLVKIESLKEDVADLRKWKGAVEDVASLSDIKELKSDVKSLKNFRTSAITVWLVVQVLIGILIAFREHLI